LSLQKYCSAKSGQRSWHRPFKMDFRDTMITMSSISQSVEV